MFVWAGLCAYNPLNVVQRPDSKMPAPKLVFYTNIELVEMLSVSVIHDEVLLLLGAHAGLRAGEIIDLRWHDVSLDDQILQVGEGNGVTVQISNRLALSLQELYEDAHYSNGMSRYILDLRTQYGVYNRVRNICRAANVDFKGVQGLRNHCGRSVLIKTGDARAVQRHLRLKSIEQVQRFSSQDNTFSIEIADL